MRPEPLLDTRLRAVAVAAREIGHRMSTVVNDSTRTVPGVRTVESFPRFGLHVDRVTWDLP